MSDLKSTQNFNNECLDLYPLPPSPSSCAVASPLSVVTPSSLKRPASSNSPQVPPGAKQPCRRRLNNELKAKVLALIDSGDAIIKRSNQNAERITTPDGEHYYRCTVCFSMFISNGGTFKKHTSLCGSRNIKSTLSTVLEPLVNQGCTGNTADGTLSTVWEPVVNQSIRGKPGKLSVDRNGHFSYTVDTSGFQPDEINVNLEGNKVVISGEHSENEENESVHWSVVRRITLSDDLDLETLKCDLEDNNRLLISAVRKVLPGTQKRVIPINIVSTNDSNFLPQKSTSAPTQNPNN